MHVSCHHISRIRHLGNVISAVLLITWEMQSRYHFGARNIQQGGARGSTKRGDAEFRERI